MIWEFEDQLKILYKKFLTSLDSVSHDTIEKTKVKAITVMAKLLTENCEEEQVCSTLKDIIYFLLSYSMIIPGYSILNAKNMCVSHSNETNKHLLEIYVQLDLNASKNINVKFTK